MSYRKPSAKQGGFAGVVFLVIALIAIVMAAISAMSRNNSVGSPEQSAKTNASVLLKQAADLRTGFDRMLIDGRGAAAINFDAIGNDGLFSSASGTIYSIKPVPPASAVAGGVPAFTFNDQVTLPGVGPGGADFVFTVGNLNGEVCRQINRMLYGDAPNAAPAASLGTLAAWTTAPLAINDAGGTPPANYLGRSEGCIAASGGEFVYYKTAIEN